mgnify:CR=1 FL=1
MSGDINTFDQQSFENGIRRQFPNATSINIVYSSASIQANIQISFNTQPEADNAVLKIISTTPITMQTWFTNTTINITNNPQSTVKIAPATVLLGPSPPPPSPPPSLPPNPPPPSPPPDLSYCVLKYNQSNVTPERRDRFKTLEYGSEARASITDILLLREYMGTRLTLSPQKLICAEQFSESIYSYSQSITTDSLRKLLDNIAETPNGIPSNIFY